VHDLGQVDAVKDDPGVRGGRSQGDLDPAARMQANALGRNRFLDGSLTKHDDVWNLWERNATCLHATRSGIVTFYRGNYYVLFIQIMYVFRRHWPCVGAHTFQGKKVHAPGA